MPNQTAHRPATTPDALGRLVVERANAGDLALTFTRRPNGAHRQPEGTWLSAIDHPTIPA